jgi:hypothetical protein
MAEPDFEVLLAAVVERLTPSQRVHMAKHTLAALTLDERETLVAELTAPTKKRNGGTGSRSDVPNHIPNGSLWVKAKRARLAHG